VTVERAHDVHGDPIRSISARRLGWAFLLGIVLVTFVVFAPALRNDFVNWDDPEMVVFNTGVRGLGPAQIRWAFTTFHSSLYHPLTWLSLSVDYVLWGGEPWGYHLTNILLHALNAGLTFLLTRRLIATALGDNGRATSSAAAFAALLFALHPMRAEPVAWVTARRDLLAAFFVLSTLLAYLRAVAGSESRISFDPTNPERADRRWLALAAVFYLAAALSKAISMTLPLVLVVLDAYPLRRFGRGRGVWLEKAPFAMIAAATAVVAAWGVGSGEFSPLEAYGVLARLAMVAYSLAFYAWKTIMPTGLSPVYEIPPVLDPFAARFLASGSAVVVVTATVAALHRRAPAVAAAWACYLIPILPVSGLTHAGHQLVYDRYSYLPAIALMTAVGGGVAVVLRAWRRGRLRTTAVVALCLAMLIVALAWGHLARRQIAVWRDSETLWTAAIARDPACSICRAGLGTALRTRGRIDEAERELRHALALKANLPVAKLHLALLLNDRAADLADAGRYGEAVALFTEAERLLPDHPQVSANLERARAALRARQ
jgi:tetratricopeptide (TPR) repeat protein